MRGSAQNLLRRRRMNRRYNLRTKLILGLMIFGAVLAVCISVAVADRYRSSMEEHYKEDAFAYARIASEYIDGDTIQRYVDTLEKDSYYYEVQDFLLDIKLNSGLTYYYV